MSDSLEEYRRGLMEQIWRMRDVERMLALVCLAGEAEPQDAMDEVLAAAPAALKEDPLDGRQAQIDAAVEALDAADLSPYGMSWLLYYLATQAPQSVRRGVKVGQAVSIAFQVDGELHRPQMSGLWLPDRRARSRGQLPSDDRRSMVRVAAVLRRHRPGAARE